MLWYKIWLETRWRFLIGLILLAAVAALIVFTQPEMVSAPPDFKRPDGKVDEEMRVQYELSREYRGYIWVAWWDGTLCQFWTILAIVLATGGLMSERARGTAPFTLSLPISRRRHLAVRAAFGAAQIAALAIIPSLLIPGLSPLIGQSYSPRDTAVHVIALVAGGSVFFFLSFFFSALFADQWRPFLITCGVAIGLSVLWSHVHLLGAYSAYGVMSAESYFRSGILPWNGIIACVAVSAMLLCASMLVTEKKDF